MRPHHTADASSDPEPTHTVVHSKPSNPVPRHNPPGGVEELPHNESVEAACQSLLQWKPARTSASIKPTPKVLHQGTSMLSCSSFHGPPQCRRFSESSKFLRPCGYIFLQMSAKSLILLYYDRSKCNSVANSHKLRTSGQKPVCDKLQMVAIK